MRKENTLFVKKTKITTNQYLLFCISLCKCISLLANKCLGTLVNTRQKTKTEEKTLFNKVVNFVTVHVDYFNDVLTTFLGLECVSCVAVYVG